MLVSKLLIVGVALLALQSFAQQTVGGSFTSRDGNYKASWTTSDGFLEVSMAAKTRGWVGFGFKKTNSQPHVGTTMVVGTFSENTGTAQVLERYSDQKGMPDLLFVNPNRVVNGSEADGWTTIVFRRPIIGQPLSADVPNAVVLVQWAYGQIDTFVQHAGRARGSFSANLLAAAPARPTTTAAPARPTTTAAPARPTTTAAPARPTTTAAPVPPKTTKGAFSSSDGNYKASWSVFNGTMEITLTAKTTGWVAFGYNKPGNRRPHIDTQVVSAFVADGFTQIAEYKSNQVGRPSLLFENVNQVLSSSESNGITTVVFTRPVAGGFSVPPIENAVVLVQWAYGSGDDFVQHATSARGAFSVNLLANSA